MSKITFSSHLRFKNAGRFHERIERELAIPMRKSHKKGDPFPEHIKTDSKFWDEDFCSFGNSLDSTSSLDPHVIWVSKLLEHHQDLINEIKAHGGQVECMLICSSESTPGCEVEIQNRFMALLAQSGIDLRCTFFLIPKIVQPS